MPHARTGEHCTNGVKVSSSSVSAEHGSNGTAFCHTGSSHNSETDLGDDDVLLAGSSSISSIIFLFFFCIRIQETMNAVRVLIGIDTFWHHLRHMKSLSLILRSCKTLRKECDVAFAVAAMGKDGKITKVWARRWLGMSAGWVANIKAESFTLVVALKVLAAHGGLIANSPRAIAMRKKEDVERQAKRADIARRAKQLMDEENARNQAIQERKEALDTRMKTENLPCRGYFYNECLDPNGPEINEATIAELRFRNQVWNNANYDRIVHELVNDAGFHYKGIHAEAREIFRERYVVDDRGFVKGRK